ncbi:protoporphyrinogen oxidase [Virgisporangium aliadipatigenens]|uniref:Coproporphyrinogen III oxidase n=1 Tax=Virgisporangium aliadipatigenens TaxID=741659 RepID=A0A8J3YY68_9ACTN|nr:protoporphyrinogen oxidase [Virgisporangium aliadipatigenens]GIJ51875.1 protoporphyrinogen oxidase [Virgisporangium aliadipatigenens]
MRVVVVGGGISGLAAAHRVAEAGADVLVVEQSPAPGGKLRTVALPSGDPVETGAEAFAVRDPQTGAPSPAAELIDTLGLTASLERPKAARAGVVTDSGGLDLIPGGTLFGIPGDPSMERAADNGPLLSSGDDVSVGRIVRARLGDEVADRFVDPMLGGVYAGRADGLSLATTVPALAQACAVEGTLTGAVRRVLERRPPAQGLFATLHSGLSSLTGALVDAVGADNVRTGRPVRQLCPTGVGRWRLTVGSTRDPETFIADAVVLAVPATPAARLLADSAPAAVAPVEVLDYASMVLVTLELPECELPSVDGAELSGFLVPAVTPFHIKASTFLDRKWPHLRRPGRTLVRVSIGRYGETALLQRPDGELAAIAAAELAAIAGTPATPLAAHVHRWGGALPQYAPGHLDRVAAARAALPPTLALAGAAYDGVGIPACVRSGRVAAERVLSALADSDA